MKLALISDIHGNIEALDAVLADIDQRAPRATIVCAGDVVGYGPDPGECIQRLRSRAIPTVMGNHDEMVLGRRDFSRCVYAGIIAARWTRQHVAEDDLQFLQGLPAFVHVTPEVLVCHGTVDDADRYISDTESAVSALELVRRRFPKSSVMVCGHTHHAAVYSKEFGFGHAETESEFTLPHDSLCLINPGAVGQSRDGKSMARYAVLDMETRQAGFFGVRYDHAATIDKLRRAGLVPLIDLQRPVGLARYAEAVKKRWARFRYKSNPGIS